MRFHAPQEATRILGDAINLCRLGQFEAESEESDTFGMFGGLMGWGRSTMKAQVGRGAGSAWNAHGDLSRPRRP